LPLLDVQDLQATGRQRRANGHVRPHDLRHTFVTRLLDLGVPIEQVNYLAGHKSMAMTKHYDHTREERYGGVIEALVVARTVTPQNSVACFHGYG
jgi:site-specific recombinase XerD